MHFLRNVLGVAGIAFAVATNAHASSASLNARGLKEDYVRAPLPPGFQVVNTELEGPVFADAQGRTLYKWPKKQMRNGDAGEVEEKPTCDNHIYRETGGYMSPYPAGLELPEVESRPSCVDVWPPVLASADAKPIGKWKIVTRLDGRKQWAYGGWSLYTSIMDKKPGDVLGGSAMFHHGESAAQRHPVGPEPNVPPQFEINTTMFGRLAVLHEGWSIYTYEGDGRNKSNCAGACLDGWAPIIAAEYARPVGEWTTFERALGVRQWAFRGMPVYRHLTDPKINSLDGGDIPRWHNVYTQMAPEPPKGFTLKDTAVGVVLGDSDGRTVYQYVCDDDAPDQLACDHPNAPQAYRFAICGGGDPDRCVKTFPYMIAPVGAKSGNTIWGTMYIDPKTGKKADADKPGALNVWAFRGRPVYTYVVDKKTYEMNAQDWGEFNGQRNGFRALVYRLVFG